MRVRIEGLPVGEPLDMEQMRLFLARRTPGRPPWSSYGKSDGDIRVLSGLTEDLTDGEPLEFSFAEEQDSRDAERLRAIPRPGHADFAVYVKYGLQADVTEGIFSGRVTAPLCGAGNAALQILARQGVHVGAHIASVGETEDAAYQPTGLTLEELSAPGKKGFPVLDDECGMEMIQTILRAKSAGSSVGGIVEGCVLGLPAGLGGPVFENLESKLASILFSIPAVKGVDFGEGFRAARLSGRRNNDAYMRTGGVVMPRTNHAGGILGGISTGMPLLFRVAFKPTPTIAQEQETVDMVTGEKVVLVGRIDRENQPRGRHERLFEPTQAAEPGTGKHMDRSAALPDGEEDGFTDLRTGERVRLIETGSRYDPCIVPRAVPCVEAAAGIAVLDVLLSEQAGGNLPELRRRLDALDRDLTELFRRRLEAEAEVSQLRRNDSARMALREEELLRRVEARLGEAFSPYGRALYEKILELSRAYLREKSKEE